LIALFSDFGVSGPYVGQMKAVFTGSLANVPVIDLMHDAPQFNSRSSSYLLAAITNYLPKEMIVVAVVDPGVGSPRKALALCADDRWFVGPDNGLLEVVANHAEKTFWYEINYDQSRVSASFHGRDVFAPAALKLLKKENLNSFLSPVKSRAVNNELDLQEIIYIDSYGNLMTGIRASVLSKKDKLNFKGDELTQCTTFSDVVQGQPLFYENSQGLIEIAVNSGCAKTRFNASIGDKVIVTN